MKHQSELHDAHFIQAYSLSLVVNKIALREFYTSIEELQKYKYVFHRIKSFK